MDLFGGNFLSDNAEQWQCGTTVRTTDTFTPSTVRIRFGGTAAKQLPILFLPPDHDRLKELGLTRLDKRRLRSDIIETFKIINGNYDIDTDLFFKLDEGGRRDHSKNCF